MLIQYASEKLYNNPIRAIVREYYQNARDSHTMAGCSAVPIEITAPTITSPSYKIRDYGVSMNEEELDELFFSIGNSNKRDSNEMIGAYGIGKLVFASYHKKIMHLTIFNDNEKVLFLVTLNEGKSGIFELGREPSNEPRGVLIDIPVNVDDCQRFAGEIERMVRYASVKPIVHNLNLESVLESKNTYEDENFAINPLNHFQITNAEIPTGLDFGEFLNHAEMSDLRQKSQSELGYRNSLKAALDKYGVELKFKVGELDLTSSRDDVQLTDKSIRAIREKLKALVPYFYNGLVDLVAKDDSLYKAIETASALRNNEQVDLYNTLRVLQKEESEAFKVTSLVYTHEITGAKIPYNQLGRELSIADLIGYAYPDLKASEKPCFNAYTTIHNAKFYTCFSRQLEKPYDSSDIRIKFMKDISPDLTVRRRSLIGNESWSSTVYKPTKFIFRTWGKNYNVIKARIFQNFFEKDDHLPWNSVFYMLEFEDAEMKGRMIKALGLTADQYCDLDDLEYTAPKREKVAADPNAPAKPKVKKRDTSNFMRFKAGGITETSYYDRPMTSKARDLWDDSACIADDIEKTDKTVVYIPYKKWLYDIPTNAVNTKWADNAARLAYFMRNIRPMYKDTHYFAGIHSNEIKKNPDVVKDYMSFEDFYTNVFLKDLFTKDNLFSTMFYKFYDRREYSIKNYCQFISHADKIVAKLDFKTIQELSIQKTQYIDQKFYGLVNAFEIANSIYASRHSLNTDDFLEQASKFFTAAVIKKTREKVEELEKAYETFKTSLERNYPLLQQMSVFNYSSITDSDIGHTINYINGLHLVRKAKKKYKNN
jgi:hypothetical protein